MPLPPEFAPRKIRQEALTPEDGTTQLLRGGSLILFIGVVAVALLMTVLGGVGVEGARTNAGWLALIIGMMCVPFGLMLTALGVAKWLRRRKLRKDSDSPWRS